VESLLLDKPQDPDARIVKARLLFLNKETDESKALYLELMKEAKGQADKKMIATLYDEFMERFPKAPLPPDLLFAAGRVFFEMEYERNALEAFSELEKSGELPDFSAKALFYLGRIKAELENNPAAAKVLFQDFLSKYPDHPWADQARELLNRISL
jgi:tetratricopeptide (TPR) repeat protein